MYPYLFYEWRTSQVQTTRTPGLPDGGQRSVETRSRSGMAGSATGPRQQGAANTEHQLADSAIVQEHPVGRRQRNPEGGVAVSVGTAMDVTGAAGGVVVVVVGPSVMPEPDMTVPVPARSLATSTPTADHGDCGARPDDGR